MRLLPYDFNHDRKPDFVLLNPSTRQRAGWYMNNNVRIGGALYSGSAGWLESNRCGGFQW